MFYIFSSQFPKVEYFCPPQYNENLLVPLNKHQTLATFIFCCSYSSSLSLFFFCSVYFQIPQQSHHTKQQQQQQLIMIVDQFALLSSTWCVYLVEFRTDFAKKQMKKKKQFDICANVKNKEEHTKSAKHSAFVCTYTSAPFSSLKKIEEITLLINIAKL